MLVHVKFLNGDTVVIEMETYSEDGVRVALNFPRHLKIIEEEKEEEEKKEEEETIKNVYALFLPVHESGLAFKTILNQYFQYINEPVLARDTMDESHRDNTSRYTYYFTQVPLLLSDSGKDGKICGDTYVNEHHTALEFLSDVILNFQHLDMVLLNSYKQLCKTSDSTSLKNIVTRLCSNIRTTVHVRGDVSDDIEDLIVQNRLELRGKLLCVIQSYCNYVHSIFDSIHTVTLIQFVSSPSRPPTHV